MLPTDAVGQAQNDLRQLAASCLHYRTLVEARTLELSQLQKLAFVFCLFGWLFLLEDAGMFVRLYERMLFLFFLSTLLLMHNG
jgi:hypothetical protein